MSVEQIVDVSYARISTNTTSQLSSVANQLKTLKNNKNHGRLVVHSGSGSKQMSKELKDFILDAKNKGKSVRLNVVAFDRVTRNFGDIDFIRNNIRYINVLDDGKVYDVNSELPFIVNKIMEGIQELGNIRRRIIREKPIKQEGDETPAPTKKELTDRRQRNSRKRIRETSKNIREYGIDNNVLAELEEFIALSQNIKTKEDWLRLCEMEREFDVNSDEIKRSYMAHQKEYRNNKDQSKVLKKTKGDIDRYCIARKDILTIVLKVIKNSNDENDNFVIRNFFNSHYNHAKKHYDYGDEEDEKGDTHEVKEKLDELYSLFDKMGLDKNDCETFVKLTKKLVK